MRLGIITPVLTLLPGAHAKWERTGTLHDVRRIAQAADEIGVDHLTCSEHVVVPDDVADTRGGRYWDPPATLGFLAADTTRIRLATNVVVLGYHHPLALAKRYGTLDQVSGGRLVLGVGVGSLREEFDLLGAPFDDRGARADDSMRALRAAMSDVHPSYDGEYVSFDGVRLEPCALQDEVPLWVGGRTRRSLRRAVELGDGWCPFGMGPDELGAALAAAAHTDAWTARARPLDIVLQPIRALDPMGDAATALDTLAALRSAGATMVDVRLVHHSPEHYVEQMTAAVELAAPL